MAQVHNDRNRPEDWLAFRATNGVGAVATGRISSVVGFGAFVEVAPGVEGLLHESDIRSGIMPTIGEELTVRVARLDDSARRLSVELA